MRLFCARWGGEDKRLSYKRKVPARLPGPCWKRNTARDAPCPPIPPHPIPLVGSWPFFAFVPLAVEPRMSSELNAFRWVFFFVDTIRCSMAAGDPTSALQWVGIALAVSTDSRQLGNEGRLLYLRGRCYQVRFGASVVLFSFSPPLSGYLCSLLLSSLLVMTMPVEK